MKIVILDGEGINPGDLSWSCLDSLGCVDIYGKTHGTEQTIQRLQGATVAITNKTVINKAVIAACPNLKLICVLATGYNVVDCEAARNCGIPVCNVPDYGTSAVSQFTIALLLEICHQIGHHNDLVHRGVWSRCSSFCFWDTPQMELSGKTMGIVGYGRIGQATGAIAQALGMQVIACSRSQRAPGNYVTFEELLERSDVISIHCPLTAETESKIDQEAIAKMKDGAILLNTSRGAILDEAAVADALRSGKLRYAAVDVARSEPIPTDSPLLDAPNCIITPHMAWAPLESRQRILDCTVKNIQAFLNGAPINIVN